MANIDKRLEDAAKKAENKRVALARRREYFVSFAKCHLEFLANLLAWYKRNGYVPNYPVFNLPALYRDKRDKEIAAIAASLLEQDADYDELHTLLGDRPWEWFIKRNFVLLGLGTEQQNKTSGCQNWRISVLMDCFFKSVNASKADNIGDAVLADAWKRGLSVEKALLRYYNNADAGLSNVRLLMLAMSEHDIIGQGLWDIKEPLRCPITEDVERFVRMWVPDVRSYGSIDDCVEMFGFDAGDFLLSYFAYFELGATMPNDFKNYANCTARWYRDGRLREPYEWRRRTPKIPE